MLAEVAGKLGLSGTMETWGDTTVGRGGRPRGRSADVPLAPPARLTATVVVPFLNRSEGGDFSRQGQFQGQLVKSGTSRSVDRTRK